MSGKKETYVYGSLRERFALEWKIFALAFVFILIADNIGQIKIPVGKGMFILFPIFYAIILGVLSGPQVLKIVDNRHVKAASKLVVVGICPFIAKLGITAGANIDTILNSGPALLLHGFGNLLGPLLAMPIAILLGMKREAVGACHSINREYHMALINNIYGPESAEARGSLSIYIVGGMVGTIYFGLMASVVGMTGWFHPQALGLRCGSRDHDGQRKRQSVRHLSGQRRAHFHYGQRGRDHGWDHGYLHYHVYRDSPG